jgi:hypothetical protein
VLRGFFLPSVDSPRAAEERRATEDDYFLNLSWPKWIGRIPGKQRRERAAINPKDSLPFSVVIRGPLRFNASTCLASGGGARLYSVDSPRATEERRATEDE